LTSPFKNSPVDASSAICPEQYKVLPHRIACEYGPMGFGAFSVKTVIFIFLTCLFLSMWRVECGK